MYETLLRPIEVFQIPQAVPVSVLSERLKASERKREEKRQRQIRANKEKAAAEGDVDAPSKRLRKEDETEEVEVEVVEGVEEAGPMDEDVVLSEEAVVAAVEDEPEPVASSSALPPASSTPPLPSTSQLPPPTKLNLAKALPEVRGHTSYLTFACLVPVPTHAKTPTASSSPATAPAETMVEAPATPEIRDGGLVGPCTT
ncbi:hypothetical protein NLJ89_g8198 [Agrocybe chaxingu]|uniref:Uncharacterized protein n=1 Tax=Agrocybe chaxingu TaxID=84603 RepID=A0A9W8K2W6_9AGAR|nr:hypothetical protein NLJ89_g8198 [Agrocybe chaxingu]